MQMTFDAILPLPTCRLGVCIADEELDALVFLPPATPCHAARTRPGRDAIAQLEAWLANVDAPFDLPLRTQGTAFQQRVWQSISAIPRGHTRYYSELVAQSGGTARAIGQACGANPFPIIVPCHRVLAKNGLGGFANATDGWLLETKCWLLQREGIIF